MSAITKAKLARALTKSLREFGYSDVTDAACIEIIGAWLSGKRDRDLPHGLMGRYASHSLIELEKDSAKPLAELLSRHG